MHYGYKLKSRHAGHLEVGDYNFGEFIPEFHQTFNSVLSFAGFKAFLL